MVDSRKKLSLNPEPYVFYQWNTTICMFVNGMLMSNWATDQRLQANSLQFK